VGSRAGLDRCGKSPPGFDPRTVQPVAQSLYRLSYRAHHIKCFTCKKFHSRQELGSVAYGGEGFGGFKPSPKFRNFDKTEPNSLLRGKYIRYCLVFLFHHPN
jgi:hypothetical protein